MAEVPGRRWLGRWLDRWVDNDHDHGHGHVAEPRIDWTSHDREVRGRGNQDPGHQRKRKLTIQANPAGALICTR
jgi:hypothetical protein